VDAFRDKNLVGRYEPEGKDLQRPSITVPVGAGEVPGLTDALKALAGTNK